MDIPSADEHCRRYLEARSACLSKQLDALREQALALWNRAYSRHLADEDPTPLEHLACDVEAHCRQAAKALSAITRELDERADV